ncbi:Transducin/WD40 repeat protein [Quillaja saponaria]|uniref:Transducin/WD40 repeat protein n=1 Tax=Quillaja saponaria TaxID=32244 RepID=A0AAD7LGQ5_QUISA|nr:Transducin/WD40 repeat protein [Quillaja saponaria]
MRFHSWLATCSSSGSTTTAEDSTVSFPNHRQPRLASDTASSSDIQSSTNSSTSRDTSCSSLQSNLSIQTLPSVPSLQKLSPETLNLSISQLCVTSLQQRQQSLPITCLAVQSNLLYAASSHELHVYDRNTWTNLDLFNGQEYSSSGSIKAVAFCDGRVFTAHQDCKIRVWKLIANKQHRIITTLPTVNDRLRRFILHKNYVNIRRHKKKLWIEHADAITGLAVQNDMIYSVSWDRSLKIWRGSDLRCMESVRAHDDAINAVAVSNDGTVYTGSADRRIRVWGKPFGEKRHVLMATLEKHKSAVNALALNDNGSILFSGACDRSILVWEREDSANHMVVSGALRGHGKAILCLVNVSDLLFSGSADRTVRIWKRGYMDGRYCCLAVLDGHRKPVKSIVAVSETKGSLNDVVSVFSGSLDGETKVWQVSVSNLNSPAR